MATSESDDFESADEELRGARGPKSARAKVRRVVDSDSGDDMDVRGQPDSKLQVKNAREQKREEAARKVKIKEDSKKESDKSKDSKKKQNRLGAKKLAGKTNSEEGKKPSEVKDEKLEDGKKEEVLEEIVTKRQKELRNEDVSEDDMPEELKLNMKFKDVFKNESLEGSKIDFSKELSEKDIRSALDKLTPLDEKKDDYGWGSWGNWGVASLISTASAGVSTITNHVTQGLTLLDESMGSPEVEDKEFAPEELEENGELIGEFLNIYIIYYNLNCIKKYLLLFSGKTEPPPNEKLSDSKEKENTANGTKKEEPEEELDYKIVEVDESIPAESPMSGFGFGNIFSSVSSLTKLVESTSSRMISGGLDALETLGKKTMEVLEEGDPGLAKKRALFANDADKPILSQVLRDAKERADAAEKSIEEKDLARKVHFESLFDDNQGLVHLEALEMLSKQCNIKIQQHLINADESELNSVHETLEEIKELCDLGEEDTEEAEQKPEDIKNKLLEAGKDLGINVTFDKINEVLTNNICQIKK